MVTVRFAPSPTGLIHIGNARTALINWLFAVKAGGTFILRFDDTDAQRSKERFVRAIEADLRWLGIAPQRIAFQSDRVARYDEIAERLRRDGRLYACYETAEELDRFRRRQRRRGLPPVYDRAGLGLSDDERARLEAQGRRPHWRFRLPPGTIAFDDLIRGRQSFDMASLSDPVLVREDGSYLYTLPSVIDDIDMAVSHVVRGEDHVVNTAVQIALFEALGSPAPAFAHHSLLVGADGKGLSKRLGSLSIAAFREAGLEAMAVASHACLIATSDPVEPHLSLASLAESFDFAKLSRAPARFDEAELRQLNAKLLHMMPYAQARARLAELGCDGGADFWNAVRANLEVMADAGYWHRVVFGEITPRIAWVNDALPLIAAEGGVQLFLDALFPLLVNEAFAAAARPNFLRGGYAPMDPDHPHLNLMRHAREADWDIDWGRLALPVLNITGLQDRVFLDRAVVERLVARLPDVRREDWEDCGHLVPVERPGKLARSLARFGREIEGGA